MEKFFQRVAYRLALAAGAVLLVVMAVSFVDVVGRYFLGLPLTFAVEATELGMGIVITFGMALTTLRGGHISVDLLSRRIVGRWIDAFMQVLSALTALIFMGLVGWQLILRAIRVHGDGLRTQVLDLPVFPVVYVMSAAGVAASVVALYMVARPWIAPGQDKKD